MFVNLKTTRWAATFAALAIVTGSAKADLVLEDEINITSAQQAASQESARSSEREATRDILRTSEKQRATAAAEAPPEPVQTAPLQPQTVVQQQPMQIMQPMQMMQPMPVAQPAAVAVEVQNLSKSELLRRERVREELRNEDTLQERLEQLRLRDEQRRTEQLIGATPVSPSIGGGAVLMEQSVISPITERPGDRSDSLARTQASALSAPGAYSAPITSVSAGAPREEYGSEPSLVTISPRGGISNMRDTLSYTVNSRYSAGLGLGVEVSRNLSFEMGYTFTEFGVAPAYNSPLVQQVVAYQTGGMQSIQPFETMAMKQNVVDAGMKLHFLGRDAKLRPFLGGGAGYAKSFINLDQRVLNGAQQYFGYNIPSQDYRLSQVLGYLSTGFDLQLSKAISVGALVKYSSVLSARENQQLNQAAFLANNSYGYGAYNAENAQNVQFGGSVSRSSFYSITGGVTFSF